VLPTAHSLRKDCGQRLSKECEIHCHYAEEQNNVVVAEEEEEMNGRSATGAGSMSLHQNDQIDERPIIAVTTYVFLCLAVSSCSIKSERKQVCC